MLSKRQHVKTWKKGFPGGRNSVIKLLRCEFRLGIIESHSVEVTFLIKPRNEHGLTSWTMEGGGQFMLQK